MSQIKGQLIDIAKNQGTLLPSIIVSASPAKTLVIEKFEILFKVNLACYFIKYPMVNEANESNTDINATMMAIF